MPDDATAAGVSFQESIERARADADKLADKARDAAHPELAALYALTCAATRSAFTIAKASRFDNALTPGQFVYAWGRLSAYLDRLEAALRAPGALPQWRTTPGTTLAQFSGDSALAVAIQFSRAVRTAAAWALGYSSTHGKYPPAVADRVVSEPSTDPAIGEWLSRTVDELRTKTLPPADKWAGWEMNRDAARLQSLIDDEYRRPSDAAARRPGAGDTPKAVHNADFTMVNWYGTEYTFALGVQSSAVQALWAEWDKTGLGLHQETIRNAIDVERDSFRMDTAFRNHQAFGTMIQRCGNGRYKLAPPSGEPPAPAPPVKKKRQKRA